MNDGFRLTEAAGEPSPKGAAVDRLRAVWSRRKWLAILVFAVPATGAVSLIFALPNVYRSTAMVMVERQQVPEAFVRPTVTSELETRLHTISQEILSRSRLEALITRLGLYPTLRNRLSSEEIVERMRGDLQLQLKATDARGRAGATTAFALSYRGRDPQVVALVTNTLASFYIEENLKVRERQATGTAEFLKAQLTEAKKRLEELENRLSEFRRRHLGELPQQMQANLATLEVLSTQLRLNNDNQARAQEHLTALKNQLAEAASLPIALSPGASSVLSSEPAALRLARLNQDLSAAQSRFTDGHPTVVRLREEIGALAQALALRRPEPSADGALSPPPTPAVLRLRDMLQAAEAEAKILKTEEGRLRQAITAYRSRVENTPGLEQELQNITRDYDMTKDLYYSLVKRHEEALLAESMEQRQKGEQFRVLDSAIPSATPAAPNRRRLLLISLALSIVLATGSVLLAEMLDTSFHSVGELRAFTTVPVLASISRISTDADRRRQRWRFRLAAATAVLTLVAVAGGAYLGARGNEQLVQMLVRDRV